MRIVLCPTLHEHDREVSLLERLVHGTTDGGLLDPAGGVQRRAADADGARLPLRRRRPAQAASTAPCRPSRPRTPPEPTRRCDTCIELGHRRIAAITGPRGWLATEERTARLPARRSPPRAIAPDDELVIESNFDVDGGRAAAAVAARLARATDRDLRLQRPAGDRRDADRVRAQPTRPGRPLDRRIRRHRRGGARHARAHDRPPAARRDGPHGASACSTRLLDNRQLEALHVELATQLIIRGSTASPRPSHAPGARRSISV